MTEIDEFATMIGFTPPWFRLGVVNESLIARQRAEWGKGEDTNPEHYRYRAFREFLASQQQLTPDLAKALFDLGANDPDPTMGGSIMADIVRLPECPSGIIDAAAASGRQHLVRIVQRRVADI